MKKVLLFLLEREEIRLREKIDELNNKGFSTSTYEGLLSQCLELKEIAENFGL